jgi:hypothetical protein
VIGPRIRNVTLREMLEAMAHIRDDEPFRWFQTSTIGPGGVPQADDTLRVSMGQARREVLGEMRGDL